MGRELVYSRGKMLYYTADLPFPVMHTPDIFSSFRKEVEKFVQVRFPLEVPKNLKYNIFKLNLDLGSIPSIEDFGFDIVCSKNEQIKGGESQGLQQIQSYIWDKKLVKNYKETRNELLGWDYSTKLSPWLAAGCVSPKYVYHEIKKFERRLYKYN